MGSKKNAAKGHEEEWDFEDVELLEQQHQDRTLVLGKEPLPRKIQLIAAGVKEIRCISCKRIRPLIGAEEVGEGWVCGDCFAEAMEEQKCG